MNMTQQPVDDIEIVAALFQLARSGAIYTKEVLLIEAKKLFPDVPEERLLDCRRQLGERLKGSDYLGYSDEYDRQRRRKAS